MWLLSRRKTEGVDHNEFVPLHLWKFLVTIFENPCSSHLSTSPLYFSTMGLPHSCRRLKIFAYQPEVQLLKMFALFMFPKWSHKTMLLAINLHLKITLHKVASIFARHTLLSAPQPVSLWNYKVLL